MSNGKIFFLLLLTLGAAACGGGAAQIAPPSSATTVDNADVASAKAAPAPPAAPTAAATPEPASEPAPAKAEPAKETASNPDPCDAKAWWSCVTVALDSRKVEKRTTLLVGDATFSETHSGTTDGRNPVVFTTESGDVVSVALRRKPGSKSEIVVKTGKSTDKLAGETIIDRHDGDDFQYVSVIGTVQGGKVFVDVRYMR
ncbi:MAG: hypothetical protein JST00_33000 [Deltaproteobacteria bacterium]|nr:hypothetical protein [Deltaproteobacteria bacterium]